MFWNYIHYVTLLIMQIYVDYDDVNKFVVVLGALVLSFKP